MPTPINNRDVPVRTGFITRFSLSRKNAIGVQTRYILAKFPHWTHFYWSTAELPRIDKRSIRLETPLLARIVTANNLPIVKYLSTWRSDKLKPRLAKKFQAASKDIDNWYLAPVESKDSKRMRALMQLSPKPFVLHLWDYLDRKVSQDEDLKWLIEHSRAIAVNSLTLKDDLEQLGFPAELIMFTRPESLFQAVPVLAEPRKVALLGNLGSYKDGVNLLVRAITALNLDGAGLELIYLGRARNLKNIDPDARKVIKATGWIDSDSERDALLASCFAGCLPGPSLSAEVDARSRYSIPSRCLDFLAVGLPIVGMVESSNATARFLKSLGEFGGSFCNSQENVESFLRSILDKANWEAEHATSLEAFRRFSQENSAELIASIIPSETKLSDENR